MSGTVVSSGVRTNLLALQSTTAQQAVVQNRLATGRKVNSALDNATNFFTSSSLNRRANDLAGLLDGITNGVKTLEAASNATTAITKNIEALQANIRQARQDKSFKGESVSLDAATIGTSSLKNLGFSGGSVGTSVVNVALNTTGAGSAATAGKYTATANFAATTFGDTTDALNFSIAIDGGSATAISITGADVALVGDNDATIDDVTEFNALLTAKGVTGATASIVGSKLTITSNTTGASSAVAITAYSKTDADADTTDTTGLAAGASTAGAAAVAAGAVKTVDELVTAISANASLAGKVRATNDGGKLRIENLSTEALTLTGVGSTSGQVDGSAGTKSVSGNDVRKGLITQFNDLRNQLDKLSDDASYNGINLLKADKLRVTFNETGTSSLDIQAKTVAGTVRAINTGSSSLDIGSADATEFSDDAKLDARLDKLATALTTLQTQSSSFGSALSIIQNRQDFTKATINTLQSGADALVNADQNEEAATLLALNTRQQLSQTALSLASQSDQAVLRLF